MWQRDLKAMPKKRNEQMKKETQKKNTSKCLAKSVPQKTVCVGGGDQEASGQAQLSLVPK